MQMTRGEMQDLLVKFSTQNPKYRAALFRNPRGVLQAQFQMDLPEGMEVVVLEETPDKIYLVLPYVPEEGAKLSDDDLEEVVG